MQHIHTSLITYAARVCVCVHACMHACVCLYVPNVELHEAVSGGCETEVNITVGVPLHPVTSWHSIRMCQNPLKASVTLIQTHINTCHHHLPKHITAYPHTTPSLYSAGPAVVVRPGGL